MASSDRLSKVEFAALVGTSPEGVDRLVAHGLVDQTLERESIHAARLMLALEESGIELPVLSKAKTEQGISLSSYAEWFPDESSASGGRYDSFVSSSGLDHDELDAVYRGLGLPRPDPDTTISDEEQEVVAELARLLWTLGDQSLLRRAFAVFASAASDAADKALALYAERFREVVGDPAVQAVEGVDPRLEPWTRFSKLGPRLLAWLYRRHLESAIDSFSVMNTETYLAEMGYVAPRASAPQAIVFVDISGFTRISEQEGDALSALLGTGVGELTGDIASQHRGRLIKLLGDGAMLHFSSVQDAVAASIEIQDQAGAHEMPPMHIGVACGPMVYRDGDYYGHTVNTAARLSDIAPPGQIYVTDDVVAAAPKYQFAKLQPVTLKGQSDPAILYSLL